jgi:hypothetical protein
MQRVPQRALPQRAANPALRMQEVPPHSLPGAYVPLSRVRALGDGLWSKGSRLSIARSSQEVSQPVGGVALRPRSAVGAGFLLRPAAHADTQDTLLLGPPVLEESGYPQASQAGHRPAASPESDSARAWSFVPGSRERRNA